MSTSRDYYEILGVSRNASADEIRRAHRKLARRYHPDVNKEEGSSEKFSEVQEAYDVLSDPEKRAAYDRFGHAGIGAGQAAGGAGPHTSRSGDSGWSYSVGGGPGIDPDAFGSIFDELFGGPGGGGSSSFGRRRAAGPSGTGFGARATPPGRDVQRDVTVTFMTAALGGMEHVRIHRMDGSTESIEVKIPPGIETGGKLRLKGRGEASAGGGPPGDLILNITVGRHPYFRRDGLDIFVDVPISVTEAAFGATVTVPLLTGSANIKVPPGSSSGKKIRIPGRGITDPKDRKGDFYAVIQIAAPTDLSDRGRELLNALADELKNPRDSAPWADVSGGA